MGRSLDSLAGVGVGVGVGVGGWGRERLAMDGACCWDSAAAACVGGMDALR